MLPDIPRSRGTQAMKFGQLIKYNLRNLFLHKPCRKYGGETTRRLIFKNQN